MSMTPARRAALQFFADNPDAKIGSFDWHRDLPAAQNDAILSEQMRARMKGAGEVSCVGITCNLTPKGRALLEGEG